ncbi:MAG TPA: DUF1579 family protein [Holophagaceae bacterium]|nr:DUF1579 family protein [Holophagaceae bacterium]
MKRLALSTLTLCALGLSAQDAPKPEAAPAPQAAPAPAAAPAMTPEQEAALKAMVPGAMHAALAKFAGSYTTATTFIAKPGDAPMASTGTATLKMSLDGRFLTEDSAGTTMGMPFTAYRMMGYDNSVKRFEGSWAWTLSTCILRVDGHSSDGGKNIFWTASYHDGLGKMQTFKALMHTIDADHFSEKIEGRNPDGTPGPVMETVYTRVK